MKKDMIRTGIALGILLVLYHLLAFMIPFGKTAAFWISYGFTLAAFAVVLASVYIAFLRKGDAKSRFYGFPIARIGIIYGAAQLVVGFLFMALGTYIAWWVAVLVYSVGLGAALIRAALDVLRVQPGITRAKLGAQTHALGFYEKLGFTAYGPVYDDAGIPHRDMTRDL